LALRDRFERGEARAREVVSFLVFEVVVDHIANEKLNLSAFTSARPGQRRHVKAADSEPLSSAPFATAQVPQVKAQPTMIFREKATEEDWQSHMVNRAAESFRL
jgi:hypothetical protein